jgi:hypothetical protein
VVTGCRMIGSGGEDMGREWGEKGQKVYLGRTMDYSTGHG